MSYRRAVWIDQVGRRWVTEIPDDAPEGFASSGLPVGPVSLESLGWPLALEVELHNQLVARDLLTLGDVEKPGGVAKVEQAVRAVIKTGAMEIVGLYREQMSAKH